MKKTYKDYIEEPKQGSISRHEGTPWPFSWHIRKRVNADGTETEVSRRKIYDSILRANLTTT